MRDFLLPVGIVLALLLAGLFAALAWRRAPQPVASSFGLQGWETDQPGIGIVRLKGIIDDTDRLVEIIDDWISDDSILALLIRIDSPGGAVAPSQALYDAVMRFRSRKPVYAAMDSIGASGGYYVASAANRIYALRGTLTGSIGVIMETLDLSGLAEKTGVDANVIKSGVFKDIGSPFRSMTSAETSLLQSVIDDTYEQFIDDVLRGRSNLSEEQLRSLADGRIMTGRQAVQVGLVDSLGGYGQAVSDLAVEVGQDPLDPILRYPGRRWDDKLERLFEQFENFQGKSVLSDLAGTLRPGLWMVWNGGRL